MASPPAPDDALPPPHPDAPAPAPARRRPWLAALLIVALVGSGGYVMTGFLRSSIPPEGTIWFASSFDPETFEVRQRLTSVGPDERFVMVGRLTQLVAGSRLVIRGYLDGALITIAWTDSTDVAGTWGFDLGPIAMPGTWRYEIAEIGGDALASGEFVARD